MAIQQQSMTNQNINNDEIDLIELIFSIWKKKWWVVLITVLFALVAVGYALTAKEQWTSKAEIIAPRNHAIEGILKEKLAYARITDGQVSGLGTSLYNSILTELRSVNSRIAFLRQPEVFKLLAGDKEIKDKQSVLRTLSNQINIEWPNQKKEIDYTTVTFSAEKAEIAQQVLESYMLYINDVVFALEEKEFLLALNNKIDGLQFSLERMEERLPLSREINLEEKKKNLERAVATAKAAEIKEYAKTKIAGEFTVPELALGEANINLSDDQLSNNNFLFLMGEKYLQAQLDNVDKIPLVFPPEYHYQKTQLQQLEKLLAEHKVSTSDQSFYYQSAPSLPLQRDKPKRALIVLIGTFLGGIIGVIVALFMAALESRRAKTL